MTQEQFDILLKKAQEIMLKSKDPVHGWEHVERVINNAKNILERLPEEERKKVDEKLLILCCAWHDISYAFYYPGFAQKILEGRRSAKIINKFFTAENVKESEKFLVADNAIRHTMKEFRFLGKSNLSIYHKIMQDADWLDNYYEPRVKQFEAQAKKSFYALVVIKILKPIFYNWQRNNMHLFLNFKESLVFFEKNN